MNPIRMTSVVRGIILFHVIVFLVQLIGDHFFNLNLLHQLSLSSLSFWHQGKWWQPFTFFLVHTDLFQMLLNMLILWMIGSELEAQWGSRFFTQYYFACALSGGVICLLLSLFVKTPLVVLGSAGAIYGLLIAYGILYAERTMLFMMIFPMKAKHFVWLLIGVEVLFSVFYARGAFGNIVHLSGMAMGFLLLVLRARQRLQQKLLGSSQVNKKKKSRSKLRLVVNNEVFKEFDSSDSDDDQNPISH